MPGAPECGGDPCGPDSCDDGDPCTVDACTEAGCTHSPDPACDPDECVVTVCERLTAVEIEVSEAAWYRDQDEQVRVKSNTTSGTTLWSGTVPTGGSFAVDLPASTYRIIIQVKGDSHSNWTTKGQFDVDCELQAGAESGNSYITFAVNDVTAAYATQPMGTCDDGDVCTLDSCDPVLGCVNTPIPGCGAHPPSGQGCETAFAYTGNSEWAFCNNSITGKKKKDRRWGWFGVTGTGTFRYDLYAGAAKCDINKGTRVGYVDITYTGTTASAVLVASPGTIFNATHVYLAHSPMTTLAPGQFTSVKGGSNQTTVTHTFAGLLGSELYFSVHAESCN